MSDERSSPPVAAAAAPSRSLAEREQALSPYLAQLGSSPAGPGGDREVPEAVTVGETTLDLSPWERTVLEKYGFGADDRGRPWPSLVAEGLAFRAKCLLRSDQLEAEERSGTAEQDGQLMEELVNEAATGVALLAELQRSIDRVIREGEPKLAKPLTDFRNGVGKGVAAMRNLMGSEAFAKASHRSAELSRVEESALPTDEPEEDESAQRKVPQQFKKDQAPTQMVFRRTVKKSRGVWILSAALAASLLAWALLTVTRTEYVGPPVLGIGQFGHIEAVRAVSARPPSLFVQIDGARWTRMSEPDRRETLAQIGRTAGQNGYIGVHAQTVDGITVGKWFHGGEVRLVDIRSGGS
jgi:hypothetical protein